MSNFLTLNLKLTGNPRQINTKTGTPMTTAFGFGKLANDSPDLSLSVVCFNEVAEELAKYSKGDVINLAGQLKINVYEKDGLEKEQLQILADGIAGKRSPKQVRQKPRQQKVASKNDHQSSMDFQDSTLNFNSE